VGDDVIEQLRGVIKNDTSGIVRYYAVRSIGKLVHAVVKRRPDLAFEICTLCSEALANDQYDRVRRGALDSLSIMGDMHKRRPELAQRVREACSKAYVKESYDIIRCDCCIIMGRVGQGHGKGAALLFKPFETAPTEDSSELVRLISQLMLTKLGKTKSTKEMSDSERLRKDLKGVEKYLRTHEHWSYWSNRECIAKWMGEMGSMCYHYDQVFDMVLCILEELANDTVHDVRIAVCKAYGDLAPSSAVVFDLPAGFTGELKRRAIPVLERSVRDKHIDVRETAKEALDVRNG